MKIKVNNKEHSNGDNISDMERDVENFNLFHLSMVVAISYNN